jgi:hypothetical protein
MKRARDAASVLGAQWPGREQQCTQLCQLLDEVRRPVLSLSLTPPHLCDTCFPHVVAAA